MTTFRRLFVGPDARVSDGATVAVAIERLDGDFDVAAIFPDTGRARPDCDHCAEVVCTENAGYHWAHETAALIEAEGDDVAFFVTMDGPAAFPDVIEWEAP
jgi:hypothetical protein